MPLTLEVDDTHIMKWWVDASFAVHPDMKSHTGGTLTMGQGAIYSTSTKHKINTTSSTTSEIVGVHDVLPQILWTRYFMEAQGYGVKESVLYQDNQSAILLEKNGRASSGRRTRHINIRYFFIHDRIDAGELSVAYCPTGDMVADFFTKPLQGTLFKKFRDLIMNINPSSQRQQDCRSVLGNMDARDMQDVQDARTDVQPSTDDEWTVVQRKTKSSKAEGGKTKSREQGLILK